MPEQTEPLIDAGGQQTSRATPPTQRSAEQVTSPVSEAPSVVGVATAQVKAAKIDEDRDEFIRSALPVAAALRRSGKPAEAKQLELVAQAIWQTKSMQPAPAPALAPPPGQELRVKDALADVLKAIDDNPAIRDMPETKRLRQAGKRLDQEGMLNITLRNGIVVSFVSNFTDNFSRTQILAPAAPAAKLGATQRAPVGKAPAAVLATQAPAPAVTLSAPASAPTPAAAPVAAGVADENARVAIVLVTSAADAEAGKSMREVLTKRFEEAGARVELVSSQPASDSTKSLAELQVSYRLDQPGIAPVSALLDATALMPSAQLREQPGDQLARQQAARPGPARPAPPVRQPRDQPAQQQQAPQPRASRPQGPQPVAQPAASVRATPAYALYAPTTDTGVVETRKLLASDNPHLNMAMTATGEFGLNPNVNQQRLLGDGLSTLEKFFDYALPTSGHKIAHVGLAEPGQLVKTEQGWEVVTKGKLAITDTEGNVFTPQVGPPAQPLAPTPPIQDAQLAPAPPVATPGPAFRVADLPTDLLAQAGVPVTELARTGQLQKLLAGQKTDLIPDLQLPGLAGQPTKFAAKLVLGRDEQGVASLRVDLPKRELQIPPQVMGKEITPAMQQQLQMTGVVPLSDGFRDGQGQPLSGYLAVDQEMKRVVYVRPEGIQLPKEVHGARLSPAQQQSLREGRPTRVEGMRRPGEQQLVDALVQLDPLKKALTFRDTTLRHEQVSSPSPALAARREGARR